MMKINDFREGFKLMAIIVLFFTGLKLAVVVPGFVMIWLNLKQFLELPAHYDIIVVLTMSTFSTLFNIIFLYFVHLSEKVEKKKEG